MTCRVSVINVSGYGVQCFSVRRHVQPNPNPTQSPTQGVYQTLDTRLQHCQSEKLIINANPVPLLPHGLMA
jgi:hypothetical protein